MVGIPIWRIVVWFMALIGITVFTIREQYRKHKKGGEDFTVGSVVKSLLSALLINTFISLAVAPIVWVVENGPDIVAAWPDRGPEAASPAPKPSLPSSGPATPSPAPDVVSSTVPAPTDYPGPTAAPTPKAVIGGDGSNRLYTDPSIPVGNRALVPEGSLFPDITMETNFTEEVLPRTGGGNSLVSPFEAPADDPDGLWAELKLEILRDPIVGDMIAQGLAMGCPGWEDEPFLAEFLAASNDAFPSGAMGDGLYTWVRGYDFPDEQTGYYVTDNYRTCAEALCQFLDGFEVLGVKEIAAHTYFDRGFGVMECMRARPTEGATLELPALVARKGDFVMGFDLNDKGLLLYDPEMVG